MIAAPARTRRHCPSVAVADASELVLGTAVRVKSRRLQNREIARKLGPVAPAEFRVYRPFASLGRTTPRNT
jgi:hypothetical protein